MFSDASDNGWGAICNNQQASGFWKTEEREFHINYLEIKAAFLGLKTFANQMRNFCKSNST